MIVGLPFISNLVPVKRGLSSSKECNMATLELQLNPESLQTLLREAVRSWRKRASA